MRSLKVRMSVIVISIFVIAFSTLAGLSFFQAKQIIQEDTKYKLEKVVENQGEMIKRWFDVYKAEAKAFARSPIILSGNLEDGMKYLEREWRDNPLYSNIGWVQPNGYIYSANGVSADISEREYFKLAIKGETVISEPIVSKSTGNLVVVIATPIIDKEIVKGVLTLGITVEDIVKQVLTLKVGQSGYAFVVDSVGHIIIHPDKAISNQKNILSNVDFPLELNDIGAKMIKGEEGFGGFIYNGEEKFAVYAQIPETGWSLIITVNEREVNSRLVSFTKASVATITIGLIIVIFVVILMTDRIVKPIELLEAATNRVAQGELSITTVNVNSKDEIGRLSRSFEKMVTNLQNSYEELWSTNEELEALNEEIMASEEELRQQNELLQKSGEALQSSEERFRLAVQGAKDEIWDWEINEGNRFTYYKSEENTELREYVYTLDYLKKKVHPNDFQRVDKAVEEHLNGVTSYFECEFREKTESGDYRWILCKGQAIRDSMGRPVRMTGSNTDITERKKAEEKIQHMAHYDLLTGLPNRFLLNNKLSVAFSEAKLNDNKVVLMYLDLDNFKTVNDTLGHNYGDLLLKEVSGKLQACVDNEGTVSRLGGDEFAIMLPNADESDDIREIADRVMDLFKNVYVLNGHEFFISASIGITIYPQDGQDVESLMKNADTAMYNAKNLGKNGYRFYTVAMNDKVIERLEIENNLRHAIEREEFVVYYQPQVDLKSGRISGLEALIRWINPVKGMISPMNFIPIAEETGLIVPIGDWVLRTACRQTKLWHDMGYYQLNIAINLSAKQFRQANLAEKIDNIVLETGIDPKLVELEITETTAMEDIQTTILTLNKLKEKGMKVSLDDFGTGYSSLNYLKRLPIDILKIDKGFVYDITGNEKQEEIAKTIISLAHRMKLEVVAEGVETVDKLQFLREHNCDKVQGYLFSKPLKSEEIEKMLKSNKIFDITNYN